MRLFHWLLILFSLPLAGCAGLPAAERTPSASSTPTLPAVAVPASPQSTPLSTVTSPALPSPVRLRIWVPPQFDPAADSPASALLKERLDQFGKQHPDVRIEMRVKATTGAGGLLDSLATTSAVAPLALPDLIALPRDLMETAALKGLLYPIDNLTNALENTDWFEYAQQLARLQNSAYGLPFAGDALVMIYRPEVVQHPPASWSQIEEVYAPLVFSAADPQALFTIALYQAKGGAVSDEQGRPFLDAETLSKVFSYYSEAEQRGLMPYWLTQYQNDEQVWAAFLEKRANLVVTWSSHFIGTIPSDASLAPIPTAETQPFTLSTGWVWALATHQPERQPLSIELAEFLTDSHFIAAWTEAAGYLPPRPSALDFWSNPGLLPTVNQISLTAHLIPPADILASLGGPLEEATLQVLKKQSDPLTAAQNAAKGLTGP